MAPSTPTTLARYKPAVIAITVVSAAYVLYLIRQQAIESNELPQTQSTNLHRSNAVRRHGSRRRRRSTTTAPTIHRYRIDQAVANASAMSERGEPYGQYIVEWERRENESTSMITGPTVDLQISHLRNLESLRGQDWPESLWHALCAQYPIAFFRAFLRAEFYIALSDEEAARLRTILATELDAAEYQRQIDDFNTEARTAVAVRGSRPSSRDFHGNIVHAHGPESRGQVDGAGETVSLNTLVQPLERQETVVESDSDDSLDGGADRDSFNTSQNMMDLLYHIGGEQARRAYYVHRGVLCNSCGTLPIQGIRYHCVNCFDYDLCEACEAGQVHIKTHIFLKIRLPGPTRGSIKEVTPPWYPGRPEMTRETLPNWVSRSLLKDVKIDKTELDALYDQFRSLASAPYEADSLGIGMAINRAGFDQHFAVSDKSCRSPPLLVYDRIFAFYDTNNDGLIDFEEFVKGLMNLQDETRDAKLRRIFRGYDLDDDGYVDRKDFLRMFRSYYAYIKEINREVVSYLEEENTADGLRELLESSQPISAAFTGAIPHGHASRPGVGKERGANGDLVVQDEGETLEEDKDAQEDRSNVIASATLGPRGHPFRSLRPHLPSHGRNSESMNTDFVISAISHVDDAADEDLTGDDPTIQVYGWPPINNVETSDIVTALGREIPLEEIMDPLDRSRIIHAQADRLDLEYDHYRQERTNRTLQERWQRRQFYTDQEEGMNKPPGYTEEDSSDEENGTEPSTSAVNSTFVSRRPSMRSRSSSKVRFEDSLTDTDFETRSNTSSRSVPINERWGGFEISEAEREIGKEILYQTVQQSYNELLDILFKAKEDLCLSARRTRAEREARADEIRKYVQDMKQDKENQDDALRAADMLRTEEFFAKAVNGDARMSPSLNFDPETASITSHNAQIESTDECVHVSDGDIDSGIKPDSTLPQFRPDHDTGSDTTPDPTFLRFGPHRAVQPLSPKAHSQKLEPKPRQPLSRAALSVFVAHNAYEIETKERGGPGRISFEEFAAKMIEDHGDEVEKVLGRTEKDEDRTGKWPRTARLGKLQFIGTWLDLASF